LLPFSSFTVQSSQFFKRFFIASLFPARASANILFCVKIVLLSNSKLLTSNTLIFFMKTLGKKFFLNVYKSISFFFAPFDTFYYVSLRRTLTPSHKASEYRQGK